MIDRFTTLLDIARGGTPDSEASSARTLQLAAAGLLMALGFGALWGLAAGSSSWTQALANVWKVPMVVLFAALTAIPGGLLTWKLAGAPGRASDLLVQFAASIFAGTLAMAVLAPLVALYYHSSSFAGPMLALGSTCIALLVATSVFVRGAFKSVSVDKGALILPVFAFVALHMGALLQLIALASPILPEVTVFDAGVDGLVQP